MFSQNLIYNMDHMRISKLYKRVHVADRRVKTLLHVNETLYYTLYMHIYWARKDVFKEIYWIEQVKKDRSMH